MTVEAERVEAESPGGERDTYNVLRDPVVWALAALAFAVQVTYFLAAPVRWGIGDQTDYIGAGYDFLNWWRTPTSGIQRMPGYPSALYVGYHVLGLEVRGIQYAQALVLSLGALGVGDLARTLGGRRSARIGAGLFAVYLPLLTFSAVMLTEALGITLLLGATVCTIHATRRGPGWLAWVIGAAALLAAAMAMRADGLLFLVALTGAIVLTAGSLARRAAALAIVVVAVTLVMGPWIGRNLALTGEPQPFGTTGRYPAAIGAHLPFDRDVGKFSTWDRSARFWSGTREDGFTPTAANSVQPRQELWRNLKERPGELAVTRAIGQAQLWVWPVNATIQYGYEDGVPYVPFMVLHLLVLLAGIAGIVRYRASVLARVTLALVLLVAAKHLITFPQPRYALPVIPLLMAMAAPVLASLIRRPRRR